METTLEKLKVEIAKELTKQDAIFYREFNHYEVATNRINEIKNGSEIDWFKTCKLLKRAANKLGFKNSKKFREWVKSN